MRIRIAVLALGGAVVLSACDTDATGTSRPSMVSATVAGSVTADYEGTGHFSTTTRRRPMAPPAFWLHSSGTGTARNQGLELYRKGAELPPVGSHALGDTFSDPWFNAVYVHREGTRTRRFTARSGEVEITASSDARIEGRFRFQGVHTHTCTVTGAMNTCAPVSAVEADEVEVEGTFQAVPSW